jgi:hypothetical protein
MSVAEIEETKSNLIAWIEGLSDINMLTALDSLRNSNTNGDWWDDLSDAQKQHINEGIDDEENGRVISSAEFWKNLKNG